MEDDKSSEAKIIVDEEIASFFDLLAQFDYEDHKKLGHASVDAPSVLSNGE